MGIFKINYGCCKLITKKLHYDVKVMKGKELHPLFTEIQAFLFEVYVKEQKWSFGNENPSKIRIEEDYNTGQKLLTDKFKDSATWIIALQKDDINPAKIIGTMRAIENGPELLGYTDRSDCIAELVKSYGENGLIEMNRLAVSSAYRQCGVAEVIISQLILYFCKNKGDNRPVIFSAPNNNIFKLYPKFVRDNFNPIGEPFYYEDKDPQSAQLFFSNRESLREYFGLISKY